MAVSLFRMTMRKRFIIYLLLFFVLLDASVYVLLPSNLADKQQYLVKRLFFERVYLLYQYAAVSSDQTRIEWLFNKLQSDTVYYLGFESSSFSAVHSQKATNLNYIKAIAKDKIFQHDEDVILPVYMQLKLDEEGNRLAIFAGLNAQSVRNAQHKAQLYAVVFFVVTMLFSAMLIQFFNRSYFLPLRKMKNIAGLILSGQRNFERQTDDGIEIREIYMYLREIAIRIDELQLASSQSPKYLTDQIEEVKKTQETLNWELELKTEILFFILDILRESDKEKLFHRLNQDITERLKYHISLLFIRQDTDFSYHSSHLRGIPMIDARLHNELKDQVIHPESRDYDVIRKFEPMITLHPQFQNILEKLNLKGSFGLLPLGRDAILYVGYIGGKKEIKSEDMERLMILAYVIPLHLEMAEKTGIAGRIINLHKDEITSALQIIVSLLEERANLSNSITHDLNAPLRNITGLVDSIYRKYNPEMNEDLRGRLERIRNNSDKEMQLLKDLANLKTTLSFRESQQIVDLNKVIQDVEDDLKWFTETKSFQLLINPGLPSILFNEDIARQVFRNIFIHLGRSINGNSGSRQIYLRYTQDAVFHNILLEYSDNVTPQSAETDVLRDQNNAFAGHLENGYGAGLEFNFAQNLLEAFGGKIWQEKFTVNGLKLWLSLRKQNPRRLLTDAEKN